MPRGSSAPRYAKGIAIALVALMATVAVPPVGADTLPHANLIVGFGSAVDPSLVASLGGVVVKQSATLAIASVYAADPSTFTTLMLQHPNVVFVEANGPTAAATTDWDSTGWNTAGWDSTGWNTAGWDSTGWNTAGWDSTGWNTAGWDSTGWNTAGWDSTGWNNATYDSTGWNTAGWDSTGWNTAGWDSATITARATATFTGTAGLDPLRPYQWGTRAVHAFSGASLFTGRDATAICFVDSGVDYTHPDLAGNMWSAADGSHGFNFVNNSTEVMDDAGHGTHVAGIAAAVAGNGLGIAGAAREKIMAVKVLNSTGSGEEMDLALGITWCQEHGAKVISMSLSTPQNSQAVQRAVVHAFNAGIALVASAGNTGDSNAKSYPAAYPQVVSVGAILPNGAPAPYSAVNNRVDLAAPGYAIVSTWPGASYRSLNGTSQAAPFVSAILALMFDANASLSRGTAMQMLVGTSHDLGPTGKDNYTGYGFVDEEKALRAALGLPPS